VELFHGAIPSLSNHFFKFIKKRSSDPDAYMPPL